MYHSTAPRKYGYTLVKRRASRLLAIIALVLAYSLSPQSSVLSPERASAQDQPAPAWITPRDGKPFFVVGANYEGPTDRAWMMWEDDKFDANLIGEDFARARSLGINTLRIFVQTALRDDINAGHFDKLDAVTGLAKQYGLLLIVTFTDWAEPDLAEAANRLRHQERAAVQRHRGCYLPTWGGRAVAIARLHLNIR